MDGLLTVIMVLVSSLVAWQAATLFHGLGYGIAALIVSMSALIYLYEATVGRRQQATYHADLERWQQSWACLKCGNTFLDDDRLEVIEASPWPQKRVR